MDFNIIIINMFKKIHGKMEKFSSELKSMIQIKWINTVIKTMLKSKIKKTMSFDGVNSEFNRAEKISKVKYDENIRMKQNKQYKYG